jgi:hypothetical protein
MQHQELLSTTAPSTGSGSMENSEQLLTERPRDNQMPEERRDNRTHEERMAVLEWVGSFFFGFSIHIGLDELTRLRCMIPGKKGL